MYVCICKAVSLRAVSRAIASGAASLDEVSERTGAGTDCGSCRWKIARELERADRDCGSGELCDVAEPSPQPA